MTTRTFIQRGEGYGAAQVSITAKIDGTIVFSGNIPTQNTPVPAFPNPEIQPEDNLFDWLNDANFAGTQQMEIEVSGGTLLLTNTIANWVHGSGDDYGPFYVVEVGDQTIMDPLSAVKINGVEQSITRDEDLVGQWYWVVPANSVFTATVNIQAGVVPVIWDINQSYEKDTMVMTLPDEKVYTAKQAVPPGIEITNLDYWSGI